MAKRPVKYGNVKEHAARIKEMEETRKRAQLKNELKTEEGARKVAERELRKITRKSSSASSNSQKAMTKGGAPKAPSVKTAGTMMGGNKPIAVRSSTTPATQVRAKPEKFMGTIRPEKEALKSTAKATGKKAVAGISRVAAPAAVVATGYAVGETIGSSIGRKQARQEKQKSAENMIRQSYEQNKGKNKAALASGAEPIRITVRGGKEAAPAPKASKAPSKTAAPKAQPAKKAKATESLYTDTPAPVVDKSQRKKKQHPYDNYLDIMSSPGLAEGGVVMKNGNVPKVTSDNLPGSGMAKQAGKLKEERNARNQSVLDMVRQSRGVKGYACGGKVGKKMK